MVGLSLSSLLLFFHRLIGLARGPVDSSTPCRLFRFPFLGHRRNPTLSETDYETLPNADREAKGEKTNAPLEPNDTIAKNNALILMILKDKNVYANNARQTCPHSSDSGGWDHGWAGGLWS